MKGGGQLFLLVFITISSIFSQGVLTSSDDQDFFVNEIEEDILSGPEIEVSSVVGGRAELPCDVSSGRRDDSVHMVLWFRDDFPKPVYSLDVRGKPFNSARHWSSSVLFGTRAHFRTSTEPPVLVIENIKVTDEGIFRCRVDFRNSPTKNFRYNLSVLVPPVSVSIYDSTGRELRSVVGPLREGSDLSLTCKVQGGKPLPQIEWRLGGSKIGTNEPTYRLENGGSQTKMLRDVIVRREHHGANLTCSASNSNYTEPLALTLRLNLFLRPLWVNISSIESLVANQRHEIECTATGSRPQAMITWWMGSPGIRQLTDVTVFAEGEGGEGVRNGRYEVGFDEIENITRSSLALVPSIEDDGERITCRAENPWVPRTSVENSLLLRVVYAPKAELKLGSALVMDGIKEGDDVYFECHLKSNPPIHKLSWMLNHQVLLHNVTAGIILSNQSLVLQAVTKHLAGNYSCVATNSVGTSISNIFPLRVKFAPVCRTSTSTIVGVSKGERVSIKCELESDPKDVTFRWDLATSGQMLQVAPSRYTVSGSSSLLHYAPATNLDYGSLYCRGTNSVGSQMAPCVFQVIAAERPSPVSNCTVFNETSDSVELSCDEGSDGGLSQTFLIEVYEREGGSLRYNATSNVPSFHLGNLGPVSAGFRVYLYALNPKGRSEGVRIDDLLSRQSQVYAAVTPNEVSWLSFALSVGIGGSAVFLCVASVVVARALHARSLLYKRENNSRGQRRSGSIPKEEYEGKIGEEFSLGSNGGGGEGGKDGIGTDDKEPDIIPSNMGGGDGIDEIGTLDMCSSYQMSLGNHYNTYSGKHGVRYSTPQFVDSCCYGNPKLNYPLEHHHQISLRADEPLPSFVPHQHHFDTYRRTVSPHNISKNPEFETSHPNLNNVQHSRPHPHTDPYFDTKLMKQKLLSSNVPESCV